MAQNITLSGKVLNQAGEPVVYELEAKKYCTSYFLARRSLALMAQNTNTDTSRWGFDCTYEAHIRLPDGRIWPLAMRVGGLAEPYHDADAMLMTLEFADVVFDAPLDDRKFTMRIPPETKRVATLKELGDE